jgi:hypothetical protein
MPGTSGMRIWTGLVAAGLLMTGGHALAEGSGLYRWETADGTVAYTDDEKRIPERYRESAQLVERGALADYGRFTQTDGEAAAANAEQLQTRLDALRAADRDGHADASANRARVSSIAVPTGPDAATRRPGRGGVDERRWRNHSTEMLPEVSVAPDPHSDEPVVVERRRVKPPGSMFTRTVTVTRQGDRVLSIVDTSRPANHGADYGEMPELD